MTKFLCYCCDVFLILIINKQPLPEYTLLLIFWFFLLPAQCSSWNLTSSANLHAVTHQMTLVVRENYSWSKPLLACHC